MSQPPTWNTGRPGAYPVDEVSHWPRSSALQFQKALAPHLKMKEAFPNNVPQVRVDSLSREAHGEATARGQTLVIMGPRLISL